MCLFRIDLTKISKAVHSDVDAGPSDHFVYVKTVSTRPHDYMRNTPSRWKKLK